MLLPSFERESTYIYEDHSAESGVALVLMAFVLVGITSLLALAVDGVMLMRHRTNLSTAGDLAALSATRALALGRDRAEAQHLAQLVAKANLHASGKSEQFLEDRWNGSFRFETTESNGIKRVGVEHGLREKPLFSALLAGGGQTAEVAVRSVAAVQPQVSHEDMPLAVILLVDRSPYMSANFGESCRMSDSHCEINGAKCRELCRPLIDAAVDVVAEILGSLDTEDTFSLVSFANDVQVLTELAPASHGNILAAKEKLESTRQQVLSHKADSFGFDDLALPDYAAGLKTTLDLLGAEKVRSETTREVLIGGRNVITVLISGGQIGSFSDQHGKYPGEKPCPDFWDACRTSFANCQQSGGEDCHAAMRACYLSYSNETEEYAGIFRQRLQEDFDGRLSVIGLGDFNSTFEFIEYPERQRNFLLELAADADQSKTGPDNRLRCSHNASLTRSGRFVTSSPARAQVAKAVKEVITHAREEVRLESGKAHLVSAALPATQAR